MPQMPPPPQAQRAKRQRKAKPQGDNDQAASPSRAMPRAEPADLDDAHDGANETRKLLAIHITREREGIVLVGAATLQGDSMLVLGRTVAWMGDVPFILQLVVEWTKPLARVFMSSKTDEWITDAVQSALKDGGVCPFSFQASGTFDFEHGVQRLRAALDDDKSQAIGALLDISNRASVGAIGGLLVAAHKHSSSVNVASVDLFDLGSFMLMDSASMRALDITRLEEHPSVIRGRGRPKEGFSLLTLLNRARTSTGASLIRRWLSRPLTNLQDIAARHDAIALLLANHELCVAIAKGLKGVHDLPRAMLRIKTCTAHAADWLCFAESLVSIDAVLCSVGHHLSDASPAFLVDVANAATTDLTAACRALDAIDWDETRVCNRVVPVVGADEALDAARRRLAGLDAVLDAETLALRAAGGPACQWTMRCIPTLGFVVAVGGLDAGPPAEGYDLQFEAKRVAVGDEADADEDVASATVRYYKNARAKQLDTLLGDVAADVFDHERRVLTQVESRVVELESAVLLAAHRASELDAILSFADVARDFDYRRPTMVLDAVTELRGAVHPLLSRTVERFIPIDVQLDRRAKSPLLVVTGPNFSGKSVVLKTVAMIHAMAQMGSYVPCESATLGVVDRIFTRVSSLESASQAGIQEESSFSIDVQQVALMLNACTPNSLLIVDEFGKGTNTRDGAALLGSVIHHLLAGSCGPTPRVLMSSHLVEMFDANLVQCRVAQMKVEFEDDCSIPEPLFRMEETGGAAEQSYGIACARRAHVPEPVLQRAQHISERLTLKLPLVMAKHVDAAAGAAAGLSANSVLEGFARVKDWARASDDQDKVAALMQQIELVAQQLTVLG